MKKKKKMNLFWIVLCIIVICIAVVAICNFLVLNASRGKMYSKVENVPHCEVGVLLGTSPVGRTGRPNQFFLRRIDATVALWEAGKIDRLLISGGNFEGQENGYNEPVEMKAKLVARGVPENIITLDGDGFRTIYSIEKTKELYGNKSVIIISQEFHNERALYLAKRKGVDAVAFNAQNTLSKKWRRRMVLRETFARVKAVFENL